MMISNTLMDNRSGHLLQSKVFDNVKANRMSILINVIVINLGLPLTTDHFRK